MKQPLINVPVAKWPDLVAQYGGKPYRAKQLIDWVYRKKVTSFDEMSDLPVDFRSKIKNDYSLRTLVTTQALTSKDDGTARHFFKTEDDQIISTVFLPVDNRQALCISTQVGCAWGCVFCASGKVQFERNLTATEIVEQILWVEKVEKRPVTNLLFMGMGEPLSNYKELVAAIHVIRSELGLDFGARKVTVSTCGLVPQIKMLAKDAPKVNLAISLHAANDELRKKLLPKSSKWTIKEVIKAAKVYSKATGSRVTFEYILLDGINDTTQDAKRLANLIRGPSKFGDYWVNLIAYNPVPGLPYKKPKPERIEKFKEILMSRNVLVKLRKPQGVDIGAGCGQLGGGA